jgi:hypothetical protein
VRVHPAMIPRSHPLASVGGAYNASAVGSACVLTGPISGACSAAAKRVAPSSATLRSSLPMADTGSKRRWWNLVLR